jgi:hypothetical protein
MPTKEFYFEQIEKELATGLAAEKIGNDGMARVCARRAIGNALTWFITKYPRPAWGTDAMRQLRELQNDEFFSKEVRDAAVRLCTRVDANFRLPFNEKPLDDARLIISAIESFMQ